MSAYSNLHHNHRPLEDYYIPTIPLHTALPTIHLLLYLTYIQPNPIQLTVLNSHARPTIHFLLQLYDSYSQTYSLTPPSTTNPQQPYGLALQYPNPTTISTETSQRGRSPQTYAFYKHPLYRANVVSRGTEPAGEQGVEWPLHLY